MNPPSFFAKLIILGCAGLFGCLDDSPSSFKDPALVDYIDRFVAAASKRGLSIDPSKLTAEFGFCKNCCAEASRFPELHITVSRSCWDGTSDYSKELLMFHELGHAFLRREHDSKTLPNGDPESIMLPDPKELYNQFTLLKREYYLDELFMVLKDRPWWTNAKEPEVELLEDNVSSNFDWQFHCLGSAKHSGLVSNNLYSSSPTSLEITSSGAAGNFSYWSRLFLPGYVQTGSGLKIQANIDAFGVTGEGAYLAVRGYTDDMREVFFQSSRNTDPVINSTTGFVQHSLTLNFYPDSVKTIQLYLILDGTSNGTVYFDDINVFVCK